MFLRILLNSKKHILRSGWIGFASVFVMTLAFLVASVFAGMAFVANLGIIHIENKSNMLVFFNIGMEENTILNLQERWQQLPEISEVTYLSEDNAFLYYQSITNKTQLDISETLSNFEEKKLPSSLEVKLATLDNFENVQAQLQVDIDVELEKLRIVRDEPTQELTNVPSAEELESELEQIEEELRRVQQEAEEIDPVSQQEGSDEADEDVVEESEEQFEYRYQTDKDEPPIELQVDSENLETIKDVFFKLRIGGLGALSILSLFVTIFIFMTVEFRLYNQKEEIGVMQLVGGSLFFIRAPYIIEGGFYGFIGALLSSGIIGGLIAALFHFEIDPKLASYVQENFGSLPWPEVTGLMWAGIVGSLVLFGFLLGAISSYLSIRRYIR